MEFERVIDGKNISKKYKSFALDLPKLEVPKGYATALIGENGAGKTTLLNILSGIRMDYKGKITFFGTEKAGGFSENQAMRERIGYTGASDYFMPEWSIKQVVTANEVLFDGFHKDRFMTLIEDLNIPSDQGMKGWKKVSKLSDGNRMKLEIASVLARDTDLLIMDEPASPLDPLMRDKLCDLIRDYIEEGEGEKSVFFSTHNIADMENVTDYVILMEEGRIVEQGFTEELKEKYIMVRADADQSDRLKDKILGAHRSSFGIDGIMCREDIDLAESCGAAIETPNLTEIVVALMKTYTGLKLGE